VTWVRWLLAFCVLLFSLTLGLSWISDDMALVLTLGLPLLVTWILLTSFSIIFCADLLNNRARLWAIAVAGLPLLVPILVLLTANPIRETRKNAHFARMHSYYDSQVANLPDNGLRYEEFNWGGMLFASSGVVYDESDEIALPDGRRS
jgi:hypothetical protein